MKGALGILGTMSDVGKTTITIGLCRLLKNMGYKVAPFKTQNISSLFHVLENDKKISVGQSLQWQSIGKTADVRSNPLLLIPKQEKGWEVVLFGVSQGLYTHKEAFKVINQKKDSIRDAYYSLLEENDIVLVEGSGSPAEINFNIEEDWSNMGFLSCLNIPSILVGDSHRGGVFASLFGTIRLFDEKHQKNFKGYVINKMGGNFDVLEPGVQRLKESLNIPCLGILPFHNIYLEEEDTLRGPDIKPSEVLKEEQFQWLAEMIKNNFNVERLMAIVEEGFTSN